LKAQLTRRFSERLQGRPYRFSILALIDVLALRHPAKQSGQDTAWRYLRRYAEPLFRLHDFFIVC
jgi:hypothetical protein